MLVRDAKGAWQPVTSGTEERFSPWTSMPRGGSRGRCIGKIPRSADGGNTWTSVALRVEGYTDCGPELHLYDVVVRRMAQ